MTDRVTNIDMTTLTNDRQAARLSRILIKNAGSNAPHKALAEAMSRTAGRARKEVLTLFDGLEEPTPFTRSERGTLFRRARAPKLTPERPQEIDIESAVFIRPRQSEYLTNLLEENEQDKLYNRSPIVIPHEKNLRTFEKIRGEHASANRRDRLRRNRFRRRVGRSPLPTIKKLTDVTLNDHGNVKGLRSGAIGKLLNHPDVFEVKLGEETIYTSPGIYVRINFETGRVIRKLFHYEQSVTIPGSFPFTDTAVDVYRDNFLFFFREEIKVCLNDLRLPIPREFR